MPVKRLLNIPELVRKKKGVATLSVEQRQNSAITTAISEDGETLCDSFNLTNNKNKTLPPSPRVLTLFCQLN